jgi:hypothetical protein
VFLLGIYHGWQVEDLRAFGGRVLKAAAIGGLAQILSLAAFLQMLHDFDGMGMEAIQIAAIVLGGFLTVYTVGCLLGSVGTFFAKLGKGGGAEAPTPTSLPAEARSS